ncbi:conserved hypothetical protein [Luminiphilus syltensis NOR5-1B]|uniref:Uncharacterized protein n=1 Tax=Luminiphilus syltensis NOR5-1B TaxID=565045 RepID=B8KTD3_9GAMM|nr:HEPN domain-containing protein [Luminiphilus syltensis]EED34233.1 conserved hypothetical protein [Luminiphilus syltensis NOR5-1B]
MGQYDELKVRHRAERDGWPNNLSLRVHRSLSWVRRAELCDDLDGRFIFLWVAFNAAYAQELSEFGHGHEQAKSGAFISKLADLDKNRLLYQLVWQEFSASIRVLLANQYVFAPFWEFQRGQATQAQWEEAFKSANRGANQALAAGHTGRIISIILSRLYTLRCQLVHGGATWDSSVNRDQLRDSTAFLSKLVPIVIELMMDNPDTLWGDPSFPVVSM